MTHRRITDAQTGIPRGLASGLHHETALERAKVRAEWADVTLDPDLTPEAREAAIAAHFDHRPAVPKRTPWRAWKINLTTGAMRQKEDNMTTAKQKPWVIVRTISAGVFAGTLESRDGEEAVLSGAIRLWYWKGAASLSQLATEGVKCPRECKFGVPINVTVRGVIEIIETTLSAKMNIEAVPSWKA